MLIWGSQFASTANSPRWRRHPLPLGPTGPTRLSWVTMLSPQRVSGKRTKAPEREQLSTAYGHRLPAQVPLKPVLGMALINT